MFVISQTNAKLFLELKSTMLSQSFSEYQQSPAYYDEWTCAFGDWYIISHHHQGQCYYRYLLFLLGTKKMIIIYVLDVNF